VASKCDGCNKTAWASTTWWSVMSSERTIRRLMVLFPRRWRAHHEDDFVSTVLDTSSATGVSLAAQADVVRYAAVVRARQVRSATNFSALALVMATVATLVLIFGVYDIPMAFVVTSLVVAAVPGTGVLFTVSSAIGGGWRRGLFAAGGCTLGIVPHIVAAMLGLSGIMQVGATVFEVIRYLGVAYLIFMGVSMIRDRGDMLVAADNSVGPLRLVVRRGVLLNLLNPKLTLFFFAFLPQFLVRTPRLVDPRLMALSAMFMVVTFAVFAGYAWVSAKIRERILGAPNARRWFQRALGSLLIGFGVKLGFADR
jgi:threonine/homoserine/homoserine lactone efflux protein